MSRSTDKTLYIIDISSFIFRAFFAIRNLSTSKGEPANAIYGVATMIAKINDKAKPKNMAVVYDSKEPSFRKEMYPEYKANRSEPPDDLIPQFDNITKLVELLHIRSFKKPGLEADDIIATLTHKWLAMGKDKEVIVVTGDKDLMQLVTDRVSVWDTMKDKIYKPKDVEEKFGVRADQLRDYLALVGDSSDNVPGVKSIGPKSAVGLLNEFENLDGVLKAAAEGKIKGKKGDVLVEQKKEAKLSQELVTLRDTLKVDLEKEPCDYQFLVSDSLQTFLKRFEFFSLVDRWADIPKAPDSWNQIESPSDEPIPAPPESFGDPNADPATDDGFVVAVNFGKNVNPTASSQSNKVPDDASEAQFVTVADKKTFLVLLKEIEAKGEFSYDLETTSLNPREAVIVGHAIAVYSTKGYYVPVAHRATLAGPPGKQLDAVWVLEKLKPILENPRIKKIGQNLKYDMSVLYENGVNLEGIGVDTMVASYVLEPSGQHNMDFLCLKYLDYTTIKYSEVCGKGKNQISFDEVDIERATRYAAEDAMITLRLWEVMQPQLEKEHLMQIFAEVDEPLVPVLARMEAQGVSIDKKFLNELHDKFTKELNVVSEKINAYSKGPINLNSPKQLGNLLFNELKLPTQGKTKTGFSTDSQVLNKLLKFHEVPKMILEYREVAKLLGTYVDPLPKMIDPKTGKVHGSFHQTGTATGRLSSSDPNLQNIPIRTERGQMIRKAFIPSKGNVLLSADYSQIELRILAHMSEDQDLVDAFTKGDDVHKRTAAELFSVSQKKVTPQQRSMAKAINFGLIYGKTPFGLAAELEISRTEAQNIIDKYFKRYHRVKTFLDSQIESAKKEGCVYTLLGRKRHLPEIRSKNPAIRNNAERMAMNTPLQGTSADLIKLAMISLDEQLMRSKMKSKLIIQVHDELVLDCPKPEIPEVTDLVISVMEGAMSFKVPLKVNTSTGANWLDAH